jgi:ubiquinone/menaquinone biosynthesis C-methylase UbiE
VRALPFAATCFAAVWCNAALLHLPKADAPRCLAEMRRVLAPGGLLYVAVQEGDQERWDASTWVAGADRFFARYAADELGPLLDAAGLTPQRFDREVNPDRTWLRYFARKQ